jgi:5S rRNA maturation endonuclease (ribonuclease M5)/ATP:corrinoid adenosyltransferase
MSRLSDAIQSIQQAVGRDFIRPPIEKLEAMEAALSSETGLEALIYLKNERALTEETIKHFRLGYDAGKNAIAIPIFKNRELINIKYRLLAPDKAKYMAETGSETWIYNEDGIEEAKKKGGVLIVEGEFDLMSTWQAGIKNVVSPASGKDSYGVWLEMMDTIPRVYIAYDNDKPGRQTSMKMAERTGVEKTFEVKYPEDIKDANEFFKKYTREDFLDRIKVASPFYSHQFKSVGDIIVNLMEEEDDAYKISFLPGVEIEKDWLVVLSGKSNVGKTSTILNIVKELAGQGTPVLVMPFERGNVSVGKRFLQILFNKTIEQLKFTPKTEWTKLIDTVINYPVYFTVPKKDDIVPTIVKSKRLFDTKFVIIDHLDYVVRHVNGNREAEIANTLQELKRVAEENKVVILIVTHIRKIEQAGAAISRKPGIEDLKGSSSLYQDPECVIMLSSDETNTIDIDVVKNKGPMGCKKFSVNNETGVISEYVDDY